MKTILVTVPDKEATSVISAIKKISGVTRVAAQKTLSARQLASGTSKKNNSEKLKSHLLRTTQKPVDFDTATNELEKKFSAKAKV